MIGFAAERLMELEIGSATDAGYGEKAPMRLAQRNGYRDRDWEALAGTVELRIPKLRTGSYFEPSGAASHGGEGSDGRYPRSVHSTHRTVPVTVIIAVGVRIGILPDFFIGA